jgi:hypothetical protein
VPQRKRRILLPIVIVLAVLVFVGGGVGLIAYDKATAIDRSTPEVVVQQFLTAVFIDEDPGRVQLFLCGGFSAADAVAQAHALVDPEAKASWDTVTSINQSETESDVSARIRLRYPGELAPSASTNWRFHTTRQDGWRVCSFAVA